MKDSVKSAFIRRDRLEGVFVGLPPDEIARIEVEAIDTVVGELYACCTMLGKREALLAMNDCFTDWRLQDLVNNQLYPSRLYMMPFKIFAKKRSPTMCLLYSRMISPMINGRKFLKSKFQK